MKGKGRSVKDEAEDGVTGDLHGEKMCRIGYTRSNGKILWLCRQMGVSGVQEVYGPRGEAKKRSGCRVGRREASRSWSRLREDDGGCSELYGRLEREVGCCWVERADDTCGVEIRYE